ncbi:MAG TPA: hypothetical protein VJU77_01645 [Chthoniobacterales bacterium]|nr:hypothetical protein [Chthoniobacterales bacterium]
MNRALVLVLIGAAATSVAFAQPSPSPKSRAVRVVSLEMFHAPERLRVIPKSDFDILLPLADIPADATALQVAALARQRAGVRYMVKTMVKLYRWSDAEGAFVRLASSFSSKPRSIDLIRQLKDGDVLVFHSIVDYFDNPTPTPPEATNELRSTREPMRRQPPILCLVSA